MKKTFTLLILTLITAASALSDPHHGSYNRGSVLFLNLQPRSQYTVIVDGARYPGVFGQFRLDGLQAGTHSVRVVEQDRHHRGRQFYESRIRVPYRSEVHARLIPYRGIQVQQVRALPAPQRQPAPRRQPTQRYYNNQRGPSGNYHRSYPNQRNYRRGDYRGMLEQMKQEPMDNDKLDQVITYVETYGATTDEISEMMGQLTFESNKLELAKRAYPYCTDQNRYLNLQSGFVFASNRRALRDFVAR